jgi:hypothetical protein
VLTPFSAGVLPRLDPGVNFKRGVLVVVENAVEGSADGSHLLPVYPGA